MYVDFSSRRLLVLETTLIHSQLIKEDAKDQGGLDPVPRIKAEIFLPEE